jgi:hypothetical protein
MGFRCWSTEIKILAVAAGAFAVAFRALRGAFVRLAGGAGDVVSAAQHAPIWLRVVVPALGGLLAGLWGLATARSRNGAGGRGRHGGRRTGAHSPLDAGDVPRERTTNNVRIYSRLLLAALV